MAHRKLEHRGIPFEIGPRTPCPGIGWKIPSFAHPESNGAFYDDCPDHPEGAYAWAESAARKRIDIVLSWVADFDAMTP